MRRRATSRLSRQRSLTPKFWILQAYLAANIRVLWPSSFSLEGSLTWLCSLEAVYCCARYCLMKLNVVFLFSLFVCFFFLFGKCLDMFLYRTQPFCLSGFAFPNQLLQTRWLGFRGIADSHGQVPRFSCISEPTKEEFSFRHCREIALLVLTESLGRCWWEGDVL